MLHKFSWRKGSKEMEQTIEKRTIYIDIIFDAHVFDFYLEMSPTKHPQRLFNFCFDEKNSMSNFSTCTFANVPGAIIGASMLGGSLDDFI